MQLKFNTSLFHFTWELDGNLVQIKSLEIQQNSNEPQFGAAVIALHSCIFMVLA